MSVERGLGGVSGSKNNFLKKPKKLSLIAEVKRKSPSKGIIRKDFDPIKIAENFQLAGAKAISVLTDEYFFGGKLEFLSQIKSQVETPLLRKDFILDPLQILQAKKNQADIILLIVKILPDEKLEELILTALALDLQILLEFHNLTEISRFKKILNSNLLKNPNYSLKKLQSQILLGINNRDLDTFETDFNSCLKLKEELPAGFLTVAESAVLEVDQLETLNQHAFDFVLIGEGLAKNPELLSWFDPHPKYKKRISTNKL